MDKIDKSGWLSMWPDFFPRKKRERTLAFFLEDKVISEHGEVWFPTSYEELKIIMFSNDLDIYIWKFLGRNGFKWFDDSKRDRKATINIANSSRTITTISIKGPYNKLVKIISSCSWGWRKPVTMEFITALRHVLDLFDYGDHPSPGSLGTNGIRHEIQMSNGKRYKRPGNLLRRRLFNYGFGGRSDDFSDPVEYEKVYEFDFDNHYANVSLGGVPVEEADTLGLSGVFRRDIRFLDDYATALCECNIIIEKELEVSPFYVKGKDGLLSWATKPGTYYGFYWKEMIVAAVDAGCIVEIGYSWCWKTLDKFMNPFIYKSLDIRSKFKELGMDLEASMSKNVIVSAFGSFGMKPIRIVLVDVSEKQDDDEPFLDAESTAGEGLSTGYYMHVVEVPNSPKLTQVMYYIIMLGSMEIYNRLEEEFSCGNKVIATNYDAITTVGPPTASIVRGKVKELWKYHQLGLRSYRHRDGEKRPGVPKINR